MHAEYLWFGKRFELDNIERFLFSLLYYEVGEKSIIPNLKQTFDGRFQ